MGIQDQKVMMAALSIALRAQVNDLDGADVDALVSQADELLAHDTPLFREITGFATQYAMVRFDADALAEAGAHLRRAVELGAVPVPPDLGRVDIHG
ncbi:hypothetical protein [Paenirhodobacter sp. CAU 1674]|uniref:hypothetical protein n=1 Tax=Paenirhodobacter sp. CAU 1674 TaxID=3032596 RepID=UPI0023DA6E9E|nr:hypothetical protein [Paenirhodobacter sp. CAU 1674]MDF2143227.1 hypothetical protein [Paenirhodobacter sp. CAU 1674]